MAVQEQQIEQLVRRRAIARLTNHLDASTKCLRVIDRVLEAPNCGGKSCITVLAMRDSLGRRRLVRYLCEAS
jgi:hypothetical protein